MYKENVLIITNYFLKENDNNKINNKAFKLHEIFKRFIFIQFISTYENFLVF